jgi:hypothetical protein
LFPRAHKRDRTGSGDSIELCESPGECQHEQGAKPHSMQHRHKIVSGNFHTAPPFFAARAFIILLFQTTVDMGQ